MANDPYHYFLVMASNKSITADDLDLSLAGSQILLATGRSSAPRQIKRPNSLIDVSTRTRHWSAGKTDFNTLGKKKASSTGSQPVTHRSDASELSLRNRNHLRKSKTPSQDFLAMFESSTHSKIKKTPESKTHNRTSLNPLKTQYEETSLKNKKQSFNAWNPLNSSRGNYHKLETRPDKDSGLYQPGTNYDISDDLEQLRTNDVSFQSYSQVHSLQTKNKLNSARPSYVCRDAETLNSQPLSGRITKKSQSLNSIASNAIPQGLPLQTKASLLNAENGYQNIKPKTPVSYVRKDSNCIDFNSSRHISTDMAAIKIQRWFQRHATRRKAGKAAMVRLLTQKRRENEKLGDLGPIEQAQLDDKKRTLERKFIRELKAKEARRQVIQDMQKNKEVKVQEIEKKAEQQLAFLQATGRIVKTPKSNCSEKKTLLKTSDKLKSDSKIQFDSSCNVSVEKVTDEQRLGDALIQRPQSPKRSISPNEEAALSSAIPTKSTLNDLLDTLKQLEGEERLATETSTSKNAGSDDLMKTEAKDKSMYLTAEKLEALNQNQTVELNKGSFLSSEKLQSIMTFLDEVQSADRLTDIDQELNKANEDDERPMPFVSDVEELVKLECASATAAEVTNTVLTQRLQLDEKKQTVRTLQRALNQQRELTIRHAKETDKEMKRQMVMQKEQYEETIKRHLSFIDQLIDDKKSLSEKCESVVKELKIVDKKYQEKIKTLQENQVVEMQKLKELSSATEKLRREKWIEEKTKKIKEMTVKGLEPEIQRLIAKHKAEVKKIKQIHDAELLEADERAAQRYVKMTEDLRDQLAEEKEKACTRERELAKQRYEKQLQQEEESYQQQHRRLHKEIQDEKNRLAEQSSQQRVEIDRLQHRLEQTHQQAMETMNTQLEKTRDEQQRRHAIEIRELQEKLTLEKQAWEENFMKKQETLLLSKERGLKEKVRKDRDKEIELVISQLEEDATSTREECERTAQNKIRRIREKCDSEVRELEKSEKQALDRYNEIKARLTEVEGENQQLKVKLKQKNNEIDDVKKLLDKLHKERDHVSDIVRQEFADRLVATEEENKRIKQDISELKARHRMEMERAKADMEVVKKQKEEELEELHNRVKQAIVKKEETVSQLRKEYQAAVKRADHLEGLLEQQRKQLLGKK